MPKELNSESGASGKLSVTLLSIQDGDGRVRKLPAPTVEVDVHRQKPTVRFAKAGRVVITEGESAQAPLRLTGDAPWEVVYTLNGGKTKKVSLRDANNHLTLNDAGMYRLVQVKDANCPGVVSQDDTFEIAFKPRPKVEIVGNSAISQAGNVYRLKGFCTGGEDQVALRFNGKLVGVGYDKADLQDKHHLKLHTDTLPRAIPVDIPSSQRRRLVSCTCTLNLDNIDTTLRSLKMLVMPTTQSNYRSNTTYIPDPLYHLSKPTLNPYVLTRHSSQMPRSG